MAMETDQLPQGLNAAVITPDSGTSPPFLFLPQYNFALITYRWQLYSYFLIVLGGPEPSETASSVSVC